MENQLQKKKKGEENSETTEAFKKIMLLMQQPGKLLPNTDLELVKACTHLHGVHYLA